ncbi:MAG: phage major capsid protein [Elusimicrobia bacterium]|nr:phage major capsid protein [Elusimicrobiota bacterium]
MSEYAEVMKSLGELRKTVESRLDDCITREKAEKIAEDAVSKAHPAQRKAVLPETPEQVLERADGFRLGGKNAPEKPWTSEYGRKFGGMRGFLKAARGGYAEKAALAEGSSGSTGGGYLVPVEFSAEVARLMRDASPIMRLANVLPMSSWKRHIPKQLTNVSVGWVDESGLRPETNPTFGQLEQVAKVMGAVVKCTDELLRDSAVNLTAFLGELVAEAMALEIERVALVGGVSAYGDKFDGVLKASGLNTVSMAGDTVSFDDIADLLFSVSGAYGEGGKLALSRAGLKKLLKLKDEQGNYVWQPPAGDVPATVWNTPYELCSQIPSTFTAGAQAKTGGDLTAAFFGRFDRHLLVSPRQELEIKVSQDASSWNGSTIDSAFMQDQTWMRFTQAVSIDVAQGSAFGCLLFK